VGCSLPKAHSRIDALNLTLAGVDSIPVAVRTSFQPEVGRYPLFLVAFQTSIGLVSPEKMTHPIIPQVIDLAAPVAKTLGLDVVGAVFHTNQHPPVLRVDIRNTEEDTSLNDCERMSRALEAALDVSNLLPDAYVLEVSSPGISRSLTTDREFISFKGFPVEVTTTEPHEGHVTWAGQLIRRDDEALYLSQRGRSIAIPRHLVNRVQLVDRS
jgi:ribosome maturation factor RimP